MKNILLLTIILSLFHFSSKAQQNEWIYGRMDCGKNSVCFKSEGISTDLEEAQFKAELDITYQVLKYLGVYISIDEKDIIEKTLKDGLLTKNETKTKLARITGQAQVKRLRRVDDFNNYGKKDQDGKFHQWYKYELVDYNVGALALIPSAAQYARKEKFKAVTFTIGSLIVLGGPAFNSLANNIQNDSRLYNTNPVYYNDYVNRERNARTASRLSYGIAIVTYIWSTIDGFAKNNLSSKSISHNQNFKISPYFSTTNSGLTLSITLNK